MGFLNSFSGFLLTLKFIFKRKITEKYPDYKKKMKESFHGRHVLNRYDDGLEKCIGCELCAWACPADAIYVKSGDNTDTEVYSPGERYAQIYEINYNRCIFCGLCIEACPTRALTMGDEYELAAYSRDDLIYDKSALLVGLTEGMKDTPHSSKNDIDYYKSLK